MKNKRLTMNRQEAKELLPIIQAFAEGKTIEVKAGVNSWVETDEVYGGRGNNYSYRIKSGSQYRPFKDKEECLNEMLKHQPFGWIRAISNKCFYSIIGIKDDGCIFLNGDKLSFYTLFKFDTFCDGTFFGIRE